MGRLLRLFGLGTAAFCCAAELGVDMAMAGTAVAGEELANRKCASCHAIGAEGASKLVKATAFREFVAKTPSDKMQSGLEAALKKGHFAFPPLKPAEIQDLVAYLETVR